MYRCGYLDFYELIPVLLVDILEVLHVGLERLKLRLQGSQLSADVCVLENRS